MIARYIGPVGGGSPLEASHYELGVERALRGTLAGRIRVTPGDGHAHFPAGTRLVAFLQNGAFRFFATAPDGQRLEDGALHLSGFYDFNAHIVSPGLTTLDALTARVAGRTTTERYEGPVFALSDDGQRRVTTPWTVHITLEDGRPPVVTGLPARGFPTPSVRRGGLFDELTIDYRGSSPRPLRLEGRVVGNRQGVVMMEFWVTEPDVFRVADLHRYLTDPDVDWIHYEVRAVMEGGEIWTDGPDRIDYSALTFFGHVGFESYSMRDTPRRWVHPRFTAVFDPPRTGVTLDTYGDARVTVQELLRGPIGFVVREGDGAGTHGSLELVEVQFRSID
ncbi:MAG: hypothetical protein AB8I08_08070 [Sandaracinaceae bacterium]